MDRKVKRLMPPRPKWSLKTSFLFSILLLILLTLLIFFTVHQSFWAELEIVTASIAVLMFGYFSVILYLGVRFDRNERFAIVWPKGDPTALLDANGLPPMPIYRLFSRN